MNKLQVIIIVFAIAVALVAVLVFSGVLPGLRPFGQTETADIQIWGTLPQEVLAESVTEFNRDFTDISITYVEKNPSSFEEELLEALASDRGPDLILTSSEILFKHANKFIPLTETSLTQRNFRDTFIDLTELLVRPNGILGLPLFIDPLVLYYNRDLFQNESLALPPKTWDEFLVESQKLTKIDPAGNIIQSGSALGLESNVSHFKEIISLLILQAKNPVVDIAGGRVVLTERGEAALAPAEGALRFYTEFARPEKASYSWSRAKPSSSQAFLSGNLAMYFGFGSEFETIRNSNPHLNFDLRAVPQIRGSNLNLTYGRFWAVGISRGSKSPPAAYRAMQFLASKNQLLNLSRKIFLAPSRRDLLSQKPSHPVLEVLFREAVKARGWLDIDSEKTSEIFSNMVRSVYSQRKSANEAVRDAQSQLEALYER